MALKSGKIRPVIGSVSGIRGVCTALANIAAFHLEVIEQGRIRVGPGSGGAAARKCGQKTGFEKNRFPSESIKDPADIDDGDLKNPGRPPDHRAQPGTAICDPAMISTESAMPPTRRFKRPVVRSEEEKALKTRRVSPSCRSSEIRNRPVPGRIPSPILQRRWSPLRYRRGS